MRSATLQNNPTIESGFNAVETGVLAMSEHLPLELLGEFDVFAPEKMRRTRDHGPPELMRGFLDCYSRR